MAQCCGAEKIEAGSRGVSVYELVSELVAETKPAPNAPLFHPFLHGSDVDPAARAGFIGVASCQPILPSIFWAASANLAA